MPRKKRELLDEGIYHVFNRGNDRQDLFREDEDFNVFLRGLLEAKTAYETDIYHYCLMNNHFHLLIKIKKAADLPHLMHRLLLNYTRYFKRKYNFLGHLFQSRFKSPRIPDDSYYLQCGRYIERNPVKAGIVSDPASYKWSSAAYYALGQQNPLVTPNIHYKDLAKTPEERMVKYQQFLALDEPYGVLIQRELALA